MNDNEMVDLVTKVVGEITARVLLLDPKLEGKITSRLHPGAKLSFSIRVGGNKAYFEIDDKHFVTVYDLLTMSFAEPWIEPRDKIDLVIERTASLLSKQSLL